MASFYNRYYPYYRPFFPASRLISRNVSSPGFEKKEKSCDSFSENDKVCSRSFESEKSCSGSSEDSTDNSRSSAGFSFGPISFKNFVFGDLESPIFEVFGIKLFLDDIIIVGLLFFLYQEGVQDEMLYIALILLLIG